MNTEITTHEPITMMFFDRVHSDKIKEYELWLRNIHGDARQATGFLDAHVIKPSDPNSCEYITMIKFDHQQNMDHWVRSENHAQWLAQLPDLIDESSESQQALGLESWFSRPKSLIAAKSPPFWKQVVMSVVIIYPLIIILNFLLDPITGDLPWLLALFISVTILSALLTYPVFPVATKLLRNWLYPKSKTN